VNLRVSKKKFVYLISPNKIYPQFLQDLNKVLYTGKIALFQLRLKKYSLKRKLVIGNKISQICKKNNVKFIVNDDPILSKKLNADGCHLGQKDMSIKNARKIIGNKIIGITCHNSIKLAKAAIKENVSYIAFGAFFSTETKKVKFKANTKILKEIKKLTNTPIVAIGGINFDNYKKLLLNNANLLAISGYVWNNKKYKPLETIEKLK
jgi:thiamine-phosphate pyrophosphorylase